MEHNPTSQRPHTQIIQQAPKMLLSTGANFIRETDSRELQYYYDRPMMLNAWTQTSSEDFNLLLNNYSAQQSKTEQNLLEKIRILEENLRAHSEILTQLNATSQKSSLQIQQQQQQQNKQTTVQQHQQQNGSLTTVPYIKIHNVSPSESVKYTIIADANVGENGDPIEIQLAEDESVMNLSASSDSNRLEICLGEDEVKTDIKNESPLSLTCYNESTPNSNLIKRRKLSSSHEEKRKDNVQKSNYIKTNGNNGSVPTNLNENSIGEPSLAMRNKINCNKTPVTNNTTKLETQKIDMDNVMVSIGPNNTRIPAKIYEKMSWTTPSIATRKLMMAIFDRQTLATHSMTGKPSPAFKDHGKPLKQMLDPRIIQDIIFAVTRKCNVSEKEVRNAITTKCADENKMMKLQMHKNRSFNGDNNKENIKFEH